VSELRESPTSTLISIELVEGGAGRREKEEITGAGHRLSGRHCNVEAVVYPDEGGRQSSRSIEVG
jgi:hypothetical protein